jgi:catechol 2,3-dioxygenase-like lactoylglutathione lyase family enzyme
VDTDAGADDGTACGEPPGRRRVVAGHAGAARPVGLSAVTLVTDDMDRAVAFYRALGFEDRAGGGDPAFMSFAVGSGFLNLIARGHAATRGATPDARTARWWGRVIVHVTDVDAFHARAIASGLRPHAPPRDAPWGERYFHLTDPDGHELSFARPLDPEPA